MRIGGVENLSFFESGIFSKIFFASSQWKSVKINNVASMGENFDNYPGLQHFTGMPKVNNIDKNKNLLL